MSTDLYKRHRFPAEIINHCLWLYYRFGISVANGATCGGQSIKWAIHSTSW